MWVLLLCVVSGGVSAGVVCWWLLFVGVGRLVVGRGLLWLVVVGCGWV